MYRFPMHTLTFTAPNGMARETYHCWTWNEFHTVCQSFAQRGWTRTTWHERTEYERRGLHVDGGAL